MKFCALVGVLMVAAATQVVNGRLVHAWPSFRHPADIKNLPRISGHIYGGSDAVEGEVPYQVGIYIDMVFFCGGFLISNEIVLTLASCVKGGNRFEVHLGGISMVNTELEMTHVTITTKEAEVHEDYNTDTHANDIAYINLTVAVASPTIVPIRLPARSMDGKDFEGENLRLSGWGADIPSSSYLSPDLRWMNMLAISNDDCEGQNVPDQYICLDTENGFNTPCSGDEGGPGAWLEPDGIYTAVAIIRYNTLTQCGRSLPIPVTSIAQYLDWIEAKTGVAIRE